MKLNKKDEEKRKKTNEFGHEWACEWKKRNIEIFEWINDDLNSHMCVVSHLHPISLNIY